MALGFKNWGSALMLPLWPFRVAQVPVRPVPPGLYASLLLRVGDCGVYVASQLTAFCPESPINKLLKN